MQSTAKKQGRKCSQRAWPVAANRLGELESCWPSVLTAFSPGTLDPLAQWEATGLWLGTSVQFRIFQDKISCLNTNSSAVAQWLCLFLFLVLLKYSWFTMLYLISAYSKVTQLYIYIYIYMTLLLIHSIYNSLHLLIPNSSSFPLPSSRPWQPKSVLWVCFCFVNMFICILS